MLNLGGVLLLMLMRAGILFGEVRVVVVGVMLVAMMEVMVVAAVRVMFYAYCFC